MPVRPTINLIAIIETKGRLIKIHFKILAKPDILDWAASFRCRDPFWMVRNEICQEVV